MLYDKWHKKKLNWPNIFRYYYIKILNDGVKGNR